MRVAVVLGICASLVVSRLPTEEKQISDDVALSGTDELLYGFCQIAILRDRGLACTIFAAPTDRWILEKLIGNERFISALTASAAPRWIAAAGGKEHAKELIDGQKRQTDVLSEYQEKTRETDTLWAKLGPERQVKLPAVYLRIEGAMALCRPEFGPMFEKKETQTQIRTMVNESFEKRAAICHQGLFTLRNGRELKAPIFQAELRRISADVDWRIIQLLTKIERERLLEFIIGSKDLDKVVIGPPSF